MKKLIFLFLISSVVYSQGIQILESVTNGKPKFEYVTWGKPIATISNPSSVWHQESDTLTSRVDTVTLSNTLWAEGNITATDSCQISLNGSFPTGQTFTITETTPVELPLWMIVTSNELYIRRYGTAGTVSYRLRIHGI